MNQQSRDFIRALPGFFVVPCLGLALVLAGCEDEGPLSPDPNDDPTQLLYVANLTALNDSGVAGTAGFAVDDVDDQFEVEVEASGLLDDEHMMHVHLAASCPTAADDTNGDGFVDVVEGLPAYGPILISLDDDLDDNRFGEGEFPDGATIDYDESTDLEDLLADLRRADEDPADPIATLGPNEGLGLEGRTVVIHGVDESVALPLTVQSFGGLPANRTLPVACGTIDLR